jgi:hypothetical protein
MLLGCCHCGETPSESVPPSQSLPPSGSQSLPPSGSESASASSIETRTCFCVFPRRWKFTFPNKTNPTGGACCDQFAGEHILDFVQCTNIDSVRWETAERTTVFPSVSPCVLGSTNPMYSLSIVKGVTNVTITLGGGGGTMNAAYSVPFATFNCLAGFTLTLAGYYGGALQCWAGTQNIGFTPA